MLEDEHISVLTVKDISYFELDDYFDTLNNKSENKNVTFNYLSATTISSSEKTKMYREDSSEEASNEEDDYKTAMLIVMYAIQNKKPITTEGIKEYVKKYWFDKNNIVVFQNY